MTTKPNKRGEVFKKGEMVYFDYELDRGYYRTREVWDVKNNFVFISPHNPIHPDYVRLTLEYIEDFAPTVLLNSFLGNHS